VQGARPKLAFAPIEVDLAVSRTLEFAGKAYRPKRWGTEATTESSLPAAMTLSNVGTGSAIDLIVSIDFDNDYLAALLADLAENVVNYKDRTFDAVAIKIGDSSIRLGARSYTLKFSSL